MPATRSQTVHPAATNAAGTAGGAGSAATATAREDANDTGIRQRPRHGSRTLTVLNAKYAVDLAVDENVFLFVPNLIGYLRVILAGVSLYYMPFHPKACTWTYGISCFLDALDGQAARALNQTSKFGAVLDMVTDRCTTACLLCFLASAYPKYAMLFQFLISLDFASHYIHMYASLATGSVSHKKIGQDVSRILWYYYNDSRTLFVFCMCNELFFVALYLIATDWRKHALFGITVFGHPFTWPILLAVVNFPICFGKQVINVVQFWKASKILVGMDLDDRQKAREEEARKKRAAETAEAIVE